MDIWGGHRKGAEYLSSPGMGGIDRTGEKKGGLPSKTKRKDMKMGILMNYRKS